MEVIIQHEDSEIVDDVKPQINKKMHDCPKCSRSFANIGHMKCHFYRVHPEFKLTEFVECEPPDPPKICRFCGSEFATAKELKRHPCPGKDDDNSTGTKTYLCAHCDSTFANKTSLQLHCMRMHRKDGKVTCTTCKKSFASQPHLAAHMRIHKAGKKDMSESEVVVKTEDISNDEEEMTIDEEVSKGNGIKEPPPPAESPKQEVKPKPAFECSECGEGFKTSRSLQSHMSATHDEASSSFTCGQCNEKFKDSSSFYEHRSRMHPVEKSFKCGVCDQAFATNRALLMHARAHTTGNELFACENCEASFLTKQRLAVHMKKQHSTKEKKFACAECGKKFPLKCHLSRHMKTHISA